MLQSAIDVTDSVQQKHFSEDYIFMQTIFTVGFFFSEKKYFKSVSPLTGTVYFLLKHVNW